MDMLLKGLPITRTVGQDNVRVTSLGPALSETIHSDHYGRKWQQRVWPLPYLDAYIVGMLLPTPDGYVALLQFAPAQLLADAKSQSNALVDFVDVSYWGTVKQWQAYLKRRPLLPQTLADVKLDLGAALTLHTHRFVFSVPVSAMVFDQQSELGIGMGFMRDAQQVTWDAGAAWLYQDTQRKSYAGMWRQPQPPPTARLDLRNKFANLRDRRSPYDSESSRETDSTYSVSSAMDAPGKTAGMISTDLVYGLTLALEGGSNSITLLTQQKMLLSASQILEHGETAVEAAPKVETENSVGTYAIERPEHLEKLKAEAHVLSEKAGEDDRHRTLDDDFRDFVFPSPNLGKLPDMNEMLRSSEKSKLFPYYWRQVPQLKAYRNFWKRFRILMHLPADTPHNADVVAQEAKLAQLLTGEPNSEWFDQMASVIKAYIDELHAYLDRADFLKVGTYVPRSSPCPAAAIENSGNSKPGFAPGTKPPPDFYPEVSMQRSEEGSVLILVRVNKSGCAVGASILRSSGIPLLDAAALNMYETLEFLPAVKNGKTIEASASFPVNFKLND
jgi:TonB family protein